MVRSVTTTMTTKRIRGKRVSNQVSDNHIDPMTPDGDHRTLVNHIRKELEVLDRQVHDMKNTIEWATPRTGLTPGDEAVMIRDIIASLSKHSAARSAWHLGTADYESIVRIAQEKGIPPARVDGWLTRLESAGQVYRPSNNRFLLVKAR